jgi:hypothetical protein
MLFLYLYYFEFFHAMIVICVQVYAGLYPVSSDEFEALNEAIVKLTLNDASVTVAVLIVSSFRCVWTCFFFFFYSSPKTTSGLRFDGRFFAAHLLQQVFTWSERLHLSILFEFIGYHATHKPRTVVRAANMNQLASFVEHKRRRAVDFDLLPRGLDSYVLLCHRADSVPRRGDHEGGWARHKGRVDLQWRKAIHELRQACNHVVGATYC